MPSTTRTTFLPPTGKANAPSYPVPSQRIVSIEHPSIVKNFEKGLASLGGEHQLKGVFDEPSESRSDDAVHNTSVTMSFRPGDLFAQKVVSTLTPTQDMLLKVALPKRTGRKRKRGSDEPFEYHSSTTPSTSGPVTAMDLLSRLRDTEGRHTVEPVGLIRESHHFDQLPDYQIRASEVPLMRDIQEFVTKPSYDNLKKFRVSLAPASQTVSIFPGPPSFAPDEGNFDWQYRQAKIEIKHKTTRTSRTRGSTSRVQDIAIELTGAEVPQRPPVDLPPAERAVAIALGDMRKLLEARPIITLRAADAMLKAHNLKPISQTVPYLGYYVSKGPWAGTLIKYGLDPRKDPKYRVYQTFKYIIYHINDINANLKKRGSRVDAHLFDGHELSELGMLWQICDMTDPLLSRLLSTAEIRTEYDETWGWYYPGTIAKARIILREKMVRIVNNDPNFDDELEVLAAALPNQIQAHSAFELDRNLYSVRVRQLAHDIAREAIKGPRGHYYIFRHPIFGLKDPRTQIARREGPAEIGLGATGLGVDLTEDDDDDDMVDDGEVLRLEGEVFSDDAEIEDQEGKEIDG